MTDNGFKLEQYCYKELEIMTNCVGLKTGKKRNGTNLIYV